MLKKLLAWCLSLMLILGCVCPVSVAEDGTSTPTDLCVHSTTHAVLCSENPGNYNPVNSTQHQDIIYYYNEIWCDDCNTLLRCEFVRQEDDPSTLENHTFVDGKCSVCDYEACKHANTETHEVKVDGSYSSDYGYDVSGHLIDVFVYEEVVCKDCGETVSSTLVRTDRETRAHTYVGGYCSVCGRKECTHPNAYIISGWEDCDAVPVDKDTHLVTSGSWYADLYCPDCQENIEPHQEDRTNVTEAHTFGEDGVCNTCGYEKCKHANTTTTQISKLVWDWNDGLDGATHYRLWDIYDQVVCQDCGDVVSETLVKSNEAEVEDHKYVDGKCSVCGAPYCEHKNAFWSADWTNVVSSTVVDQTYHIVNEGELWHTYFCPDCGYILDEYGENVTDGQTKEKHCLSDEGKCYMCGYEATCEHAHVSQINEHWAYDIDDAQPPVITVVDENSHRIEGYHWWTNECQDCGLVIGYDEQENDAAVYPHDMMNGVCTVCGYKAPVPTAVPTAEPTAVPTAEPTAVPTAEPTAVPTATPTPKPASKPTAVPTAVPTAEPTAEPTVEPTVEPTPLPEVIVVENVPVQQLDQLVEEVQTAQEEGVEVIIEVVGTEEVLTEEEYQQFTSFSVSEQLVVTLASIGLQDAIDAAVQSLGIELSEGATSLITQVTERQETLSEEEQAAVKEKLTELFPTREVIVDGVSYTCYIIDLRIVVDGVERIEQYAISLDEEGQWVFIKLAQ